MNDKMDKCFLKLGLQFVGVKMNKCTEKRDIENHHGAWHSNNNFRKKINGLDTQCGKICKMG